MKTSNKNIITAHQFSVLSAAERGYTVYMCGSRKDQPNVPNEINPYWKDTQEHGDWNKGQSAAIIEIIDGGG